MISVMIFMLAMDLSMERRIQHEREKQHMVQLEDHIVYNTSDNYLYIESVYSTGRVYYELYFNAEGHLVQYVDGKYEPVEWRVDE